MNIYVLVNAPAVFLAFVKDVLRHDLKSIIAYFDARLLTNHMKREPERLISLNKAKKC